MITISIRLSKRPKRESNFEQINELVVKWIMDANARRISVSGPLVQQKALKFAEELDLKDFKASNGWLEKLLKRNNTVFKAIFLFHLSCNLASIWYTRLSK